MKFSGRPNILAIKESVDRDNAAGRLLLTGSANLATVPAIADSLAGRMAVVPPLPFAQSEIRSTPGDLLDRLFAGEEPATGEDAIFGDDLLETVLRGGYPEVLRRATPARRIAWLEDYVALILDRDVRDIANIDQLDPAAVAGCSCGTCRPTGEPQQFRCRIGTVERHRAKICSHSRAAFSDQNAGAMVEQPVKPADKNAQTALSRYGTAGELAGGRIQSAA